MFRLVTVLCAIAVAFAYSPEENIGDPSLFEGDVRLLPDQKFAIDHGLDLSGPISSFGASKKRRWIDNVVPFTVAASLASSSSARRVLESSMREWSQKTCIKFKKRENEPQYIEFFKGSGCWSYVGMTGRKQQISLAGGCWYHGIVVHEIGHALGFWHEQSRPDRDDYVKIEWDNIPEKNKHNFNKYSNTQINSLNIPYDYGSIMHYGRRAFSNNGRDTIVPKKSGVTIGQRRGLSTSDAKQMNLMYNCVQVTSSPPTTSRPTTARPSTSRPSTARPSTARPNPSNNIVVYIRSEGCDDPRLVNVHCGRSYIWVNKRDYALKRRGFNIVVVDYKTGRVERRYSYDTHGSYTSSKQMANLLNSLANMKQRKIVLVAIQDEGSNRLSSRARSALVRIGAKSPFSLGYRQSYALIGYSGPERPSWITEVKRSRRKGPSVISKVISGNPVTSLPTTHRPVTTLGPRPPVGSCGVPGAKSRVIGGTTATPGAWPWQIALLKSGRFNCGGSLIAADWVVTAAHCIGRTSSFTVLLGAHDRNNPQGHEQKIRSKKVIVHPQYGSPVLNNDIALIQLERPAQLNSRVSTVCLPDHGYDLPISSECYITGWGKIKHPGSSHHILQQAKLPPVGEAECKRKLAASPDGSKLSISRQMLCAGVKDTILSGCHGDSGGPYVCRDSSNRFVLQGAVSWGSPRCAAHERYTVFARVAAFRSWIDQEMRKAQG